MADAAAGVLVRDLDELADGVLVVADDACRHALGDRCDLAADDKAAVVIAGDVRLDDEVAGPAFRQRSADSGTNRLLRSQIEVDAPSVIAVERLDDAREAEPGCRGDGLVLRPDDRAARYGQAGRVEQPVRQRLVRRDVDRDAGRPGRHRRSDPLLMDALAELDERVAVEPDERDVAAGRLVEDRLRRRAERLPLGEQDEPLELGHEVDRDRRIVRRDEVVDEGDGNLASLDPDVLLAEFEDDVVAAVLTRAPGLAVADVRAGQVLEFECDVFRDVAGPGPVAKPRDEATPPPEAAGMVLEARQQPGKGVGEARDLVRREVLEHAEVDDHPDDRLAGPVVRAAEDAGLDDLEGRFGACCAGPVGGTAV